MLGVSVNLGTTGEKKVLKKVGALPSIVDAWAHVCVFTPLGCDREGRLHDVLPLFPSKMRLQRFFLRFFDLAVKSFVARKKP